MKKLLLILLLLGSGLSLNSCIDEEGEPIMVLKDNEGGSGGGSGNGGDNPPPPGP